MLNKLNPTMMIVDDIVDAPIVSVTSNFEKYIKPNKVFITPPKQATMVSNVLYGTCHN